MKWNLNVQNLLVYGALSVGTVTNGLPAVANAAAPTADSIFEGVYVGSMHLTDGEERDIPLSISMIVTDDTTTTPSGTQYVIDGAFVVDDEGGPYTFTRVSYDIDNNRLDMKYSRPRNDPTTVAAANFRLVGSVSADYSISGKVSSGLKGQIGTFKVTKDTKLTSLPVKLKYQGRWDGYGKNVNESEPIYYSITLQSSSGQTVNPNNLEFESTPGHIVGYSAKHYWLASMDHVTIDYLRRKVYSVTNDGAISMELTPDFVNHTLSGVQRSGAFGDTAFFNNLMQMAQ